MEWYKIITLSCTILCILLFVARAIYLLLLGSPKDLSEPAGKVSKGVIYSYTKAMMPTEKESAYMHLPTYTAGILYHIGTLVALLFLLLTIINIFAPITLPHVVNIIVAAILAISSLCGLGILIKRFSSVELRFLSTADDYISNIFTTTVQIATLLFCLWSTQYEVFYHISVSLFLLWLPIGKTKHLMYFFFARYHLGFFYGRRGCWPIKKEVS